MTTLVRQAWDRYAYIEFDAYNEKYTGSYPNLYWEYDVRCRFGAQNSGWFSIQATNTIRYGSLSTQVYINTWQNRGTTGWYGLGHMKKKCSCSRINSFNDSFSCSGYPNVSGKGTSRSWEIAKPTFSFVVENTSQNSFDVVWNKSNDKYNIYALWIKDPQNKYSPMLKGESGKYTVAGLKENTQYTYKLESWLASGSGSTIDSKNISVKTLENYPALQIETVDVEIIDSGETDNAKFIIHTTDDKHVKKWNFQVQNKVIHSETSNTYTEIGLQKNLDTYVECWIEDTLNRTTAKTKVKFSTNSTYVEVYVMDNGMWKKGYPMVYNSDEWQLTKISAFDGTAWKEPKALK